ncbi:hypothetical protein [Knoellia sp. p5-6-4]|uniref:hypothetical protein n=1 Tax=unclassified Knoellia TaxID=2618719 RepID=UPI0023DC2BE5|nr:hypothetical protein [Knoellia sp. p5-6-4]MDF2145058.1 hypothetical protein [Knoellia sp. p5-6-4]
MTSTLEQITGGERRGLVGLVSRVSERFGNVGRRGFFVGAAVAGSALATNPRAYALRPITAYSTICGPGNTASSGWTVFCSTINKGVNSCPPGSFAAGWWKAADSSWCGGGYRYIVDCNASCSRCSTGCSGDHICDKGCWNCSCGTGSTASCDQRRICCNAFRYGQCNTHVKCSGGVHCRVVSCVPPYQWANCTTTSLRDDRTAEHSAPSLPQWGYISAKYKAMGEQGSFLKASTGPIASVGDGRGTYVVYQGGSIYRTTQTGTRAVPNTVKNLWAQVGGPKGVLGYPTSDLLTGLRSGGWVQLFEHGAIADSPQTSAKVVYGAAWTQWNGTGREGGVLGYPRGNRVSGLRDSGWRQDFQYGVILDSASTGTKCVYGEAYAQWDGTGREGGLLGYPRSNRVSGLRDSGWRQDFQRGVILDSASTATKSIYGEAYSVWAATGREGGTLGYPRSNRISGLARQGWLQDFQTGRVCGSADTPTVAVAGVMNTGWQANGREGGVLGYPTGNAASDSRGSHQVFQGGELWALGSGAARLVHGDVLREWKAAGGESGRYGYPVSDTVSDGGRLTCQFEGGTITA